MACACTNTRNQVSQLQSENKHKTDEHMIDDTNESYRKMGDNTETQTISKLSMEFLDSVCYYFSLVVLSLQLITYCAIIHYRNNLQLKEAPKLCYSYNFSRPGHYTDRSKASQAGLAVILIGVKPFICRIYVINSHNTVK